MTKPPRGRPTNASKGLETRTLYLQTRLTKDEKETLTELLRQIRNSK